MRWNRLLGGLSTASLLTVASFSLAPAASAAPTPPAAYVAVGRAYPLYWDNYSGISVNEEMRVPYVSGMTNHAPLARAEAVLVLPDLRTKTMSGESIAGLQCKGYEEKRCRDPFLPEAVVGHSSVDPVSVQQYASFTGRDGQAPGHLDALNRCDGDCGNQLIRTTSEASAPAGAIEGLITVGSSSARQDVTVEDSGRLVGVAHSELRNVAIGPEREVTLSRLTSTARAFGTGAENAKDGQGTVSVSDMVILGNPVELTRAGLKLSHGAVSEQEAYDGAKALVEKLRNERGIGLEFGNVVGEVVRQAEQVTVQVRALSIRFDRSVATPEGVADGSIDHFIDLGSSTMVLMAFDEERRIDVSYEGDDVVVQAQPEMAASTDPAPPPATGSSSTAAPSPTPSAGPATGSSPPKGHVPSNAGVKVKVGKQARPSAPPATPAAPAPVPSPVPETHPAGPAVPEPAVEPSLPTPDATGADEEALNLRDLSRSLKDARSVANAFGAFLALGLILPLARFVIKRLG